jgi:hypothetical protein
MNYKIPADLNTGNLNRSDVEYLVNKFPGFEPVKFVAEAGEWGYSVDAYYVFKNKNRSYSLIYESHCSCYGLSDDGGGLEGLYKNKTELLDRLDKSNSCIMNELRKKILGIVSE